MSPIIFSTFPGSVISGGGSTGTAFGIIQPDSGTSPTATVPSDTLTVTSPDTSVLVSGNSGTNTLSLEVAIGSSAVRNSIAATLPMIYNSTTGVMSLDSLGSYGTANYVIGSNASANGLEYKGITGTAGQIGVTSPAAGSIQIFSTATGAPAISVTLPLTYNSGTGFLQLDSLTSYGTANYFIASNGSGNGLEYKGLTGTANQIGVTFPAAGAAQIYSVVQSGTSLGSFSVTLPLTYNAATGFFQLDSLNSYGTANYVIGSNAGATGLEYKGVTGTANQIGVTFPASGALQIYSVVQSGISLGSLSVTLPLTYNSGTGFFQLDSLNSYGTANYVIGSNGGATGLEYKGVTGTANQIGVTFPASGALQIYSVVQSGTSLGSFSTTLPLTYNAGTGFFQLDSLTSYGTANYVIGSNAAGNGLEYKGVTGTANQIGVTFPAGGALQIFSVVQSGTSLGSFGATLPLVYNAANGFFGLDGLNSYGTANYVIGSNAAGNGLEYKGITGTVNQLTFTQGAGSIIGSLPQNIDTGASLTLKNLLLSSLTQGSVLFAGLSGSITQDNPQIFWDDTNFIHRIPNISGFTIPSNSVLTVQGGSAGSTSGNVGILGGTLILKGGAGGVGATTGGAGGPVYIQGGIGVSGAILGQGGGIFMQTAAGTSMVTRMTVAGASLPLVTVGTGFIISPISLTDGATILTDASLGNQFRVTLGGNRNLAAPTNLTDGQRIIFEVGQDGTGTRTLAVDGIFRFGAIITGVSLSTGASKTDYFGCLYSSTKGKLDVIAFEQGY